MMLRTTLGALAIVALAACGDDTGGAGGSGDGGSGSTTTATSSGTTTSGNTTTGGDGGSGAGTGEGGSGAGTGEGGSGAGTGEGGAGGAGGGPAYDCASYCADVMEACDGDLQQYPNAESCEVACAAYDGGAFQDTGNTLGCRAYHAQAALDGPEVHCAHAGPLGTGACSADATSPCEAFCQIADEVCPGTYASAAACEKVCAGFDAGEFNAGSTPPTDDTLACRAYHLTVAASDLTNGSDDLHCPHIVGDSPTCPAE